jgi:hypothetical protein
MWYKGDEDKGGAFGVDTNGVLYATKLFAQGHIEAESGRIGGWSLTEGRLGSEDFGLFTNSKIIEYYDKEVV